MQGGSWNPGAFFQQFLAVLPSWASDLLDRLGLKDLAAVQAKLSDALCKGSVFFASEALDIGLGTINFLVSFAIMPVPAVLLRARRRGSDEAHYARHSAAA